MRNKLTGTLTIISLMLNFFVPYFTTHAQDTISATPTKAVVWQQTIDASTNKDNIKFIPTEFSNPDNYEVLMTSRSGTGTLSYAGTFSSGSNVNTGTMIWVVQVNGSSTDGGPIFYLATSGYPGDPQKIRPTVSHLCLGYEDYKTKQNFSDGAVQYHFNDTNSSAFTQDYVCIEDAKDASGNTQNGRARILSQFYTPGTPKYQMINSMIAHWVGGDREIQPFKRPAAPIAANQTTCKDSFTNPILAKASDADVDKVIQNIKRAVLSNKSNNDDTNTINSFFADKSLRDDLRNADKIAYTTYYATSLDAKFPDIPLTDSLNNTYIAAANSVAANTPISNDVSKYVGTVADVLDVAGSALYGIGIGVTTGGVSYVAGTGSGLFAHYLIGATRSAFINADATDEMKTALSDFTKVYLGNYYIQKNNTYQDCLKSKGDPYAMPNDQMARNAASILGQSTGVGMSTNTNNPGGSQFCGSSNVMTVFTGQNSLSDVFRNVFCNLGIFIHDFAESLVQGAVNAFNQTVGLESY
ncbi:MAG: hypothetical protein M1324_02745 [Patescibacteria group bacterium]|nr:hypothetical protein [Patescibacteria group bacterium]